MLKGINLKRVHTVLEPSAGKGDLIYALTKASKEINDKLVVDAVELDPNLRTILTDRFGGAYESKLFRESEELRRKSFEDTLSEEEVMRQSELRRETELLRTINEFYVVHDDFLTFDTCKRYDLILMNPPFDDADAHLLKAIVSRASQSLLIPEFINFQTYYTRRDARWLTIEKSRSGRSSTALFGTLPTICAAVWRWCTMMFAKVI